MLINPFLLAPIAAAVAVLVQEAYFKNVTLFLDGEPTAAGQPVVLDRSLHSLALGNNPPLQCDTTDRRWGTSCYYSPTGEGLVYQTVNVHQALYNGTDKWTVEMSIKLTSLSARLYLFYLSIPEAANRMCFFVEPNGQILGNRYAGPSSPAFTGVGAISINTWYDLAFVYDGTGISLYINGALQTKVTGDGNSWAGITMNNSTGGMLFMGGVATPWRLAHVRVTRGIARTIAPMTKPFDYGYDSRVTFWNFEQPPVGGMVPFENMGGRVATTLGGNTGDDYGVWGRTSWWFSGGNGNTGINAGNQAVDSADIADFTLTGYVYMNGDPSAQPGGNASFYSTWPGAAGGFRVFMDSSRQAAMSITFSDGTTWGTAPLRSVPTSKWLFLAICRKGQEIWLFADGVPVSFGLLPSVTTRIKDTTSPVYLGVEQGNTWQWIGYMDHVRFKLGVAEYVSAWTPNPTTVYPTTRASDPYWDAVSLNMVGTAFVDTSVLTNAVTNTGVVVDSTFQKFGNGMFKFVAGTSLSVAATGSPLAFGNNDFAIEFDYVDQNDVFVNNGLLCSRAAAADAGICIEVVAGGLMFTPSGAASAVNITLAVPAAKLVHICFQRRGNILMGFVDGKMLAWANLASQNVTSTNPTLIGKQGWNAAVFKGYLGNLRVTWGHLRMYPATQYSVPSYGAGKRYARWDAYDKCADGALTNSDTSVTLTGAVRATVGLKTGKWYWEVNSSGSRFPIVGVGTADAQVSPANSYPGVDANGWGFYGGNANKYTAGAGTPYGTVWNNAAHMIGVYLDCDAGTLGFTKNGVDMGIAFTGLQGKTLYPMVGGDSTTLTCQANVNFGVNTAFTFAPPAGYNSGVWEDLVEDAQVTTALPALDYETGFRLRGDTGPVLQPTIAYDTGRYCLRQQDVTNPAVQASAKQAITGAASVYFNGSWSPQWAGDSVVLNQTRWTWQCWAYELAGSGGSIANRRGSAATNGWVLTTGGIRGKINGAWSDTVLAVSGYASFNTWYHYAWVKDGQNLYFFVNGVLVASRSDITSFEDLAGQVLVVGQAHQTGENFFKGYMADLEFYPDTALYTQSFTPPALAFTNPAAGETQTVLLLHGEGVDNATVITDSSNYAAASTVTNGVITSASQKKFGNTSLQFPTGAYLTYTGAQNTFNNNDFTVEMFAWVQSYAASGRHILDSRPLGPYQTALGFALYVTPTGYLDVYTNGAGRTGLYKKMPLNQWAHLAVTRKANRMYLFVDGQLVNSWTTTQSFTSSSFSLGADQSQGTGTFAGYMDEVRITNGVARYTQSFTPPVRLAGQPARKKLLTLQGAAGAGAGYQVLLKIGESAASVGADFAINTNWFPGYRSMGDVTLTSTDGLTTYPAWVEQVTGAYPARVAWVWVKIPLDLGTNQTLYCNYGSGVPASQPDGNAVFALFDEFVVPTLDLTKWTVFSGAGTPTFSAGEMTLTGAAASFYLGSVGTAYADGQEMLGSVQLPVTTVSYVGEFGFRGALILRNDWDTTASSQVLVNGVASELDTRYQNAYNRVQVRRVGGAGSVVIDGVTKYNAANGVPTTAVQLGLTNVYDNGTTAKVDWVGLKKYQLVEPSFLSAGAEVAAGGSLLNVGTTYASQLKLWLDASDLTTLTLNGSNVTAWTDKVSGLVLSQATAGNQPTLAVAGSKLRLPMVDFGVNALKWLEHATGMKLRAIHTVFMVVYWDTSASSYSGLALWGGATASNNMNTFSGGPQMLVSSTPSGSTMQINDASGVYTSATGGVTKGQATVLEFMRERATVRSRLVAAGKQLGTSTSGTQFTDQTIYRAVGSSDTTYTTNGAVGEIMVFDGSISHEDRRRIRAALALKWGLGN